MIVRSCLLMSVAAACASRPALEEHRVDVHDSVVLVVDPEPVPVYMPSTPAPAPVVDHEAMFACASAADCIVLEMGCCDHCNGGWLLSVNRMHAEQSMQVHRAPHCLASVCGNDRCAGTSHAVCDAGECARVEERPLGSAAAQVTVIRNSFAPR